jgi:Mycothiol maleylpyruvate isomerase N-terminal domain
LATVETVEGPPLSREALDAYLGAVDWLRGVLRRAEVAEHWSKASAVADYTVGGIAAHAVHSVLWLDQVLKDAEPVGLRPVGIAEFFGSNRVNEGEDRDPFSTSLRAAAEAFAGTGPYVVIAACTASRDELVALLGEASAERAVPVVRVPGAQVPLRDYIRTRVLEVVVHGDDVACSIPGMTVADPPPDAMEVCLGVCVEMARGRLGDVETLRAFTRGERSEPGGLRVL